PSARTERYGTSSINSATSNGRARNSGRLSRTARTRRSNSRSSGSISCILTIRRRQRRTRAELSGLRERTGIGVLRALRAGRPEARPESRGLQPGGMRLAGGGTSCEMIGVFVLRVAVVPAHPFPRHRVRLDGIDRLVPELEILDRAALSLPSLPRPQIGRAH